MAKKRIPTLLDDVVEKVIKPEPQGIRAYHGSPHDFDRFDLSKIGTGEGAQAYGHGLYFAESEPIAKTYRDTLTARADPLLEKYGIKPGGGVNSVKNFMGQYGSPVNDVDAAVASEAEQFRKKLAESVNDKDFIDKFMVGYENELRNKFGYINDPNRQKGRMYEVNIRANPKDFLDWDKSLREQPEAVRRLAGWSKDADAEYQAALGRQVDDIYAALTGDSTRSIGNLPPRPQGAAPMDWTGAQFYESSKLVPGDYRDKIAATERLREAGIPGIKYLDAGSRSAGDGSRNYVVFDDNLIDIIRKYGIVPGGLLGAGAVMAPSNADAAPSRPDWIGTDGAITGNPPWLRPDPNQRSTLGKLYDAVATDPLGTFKAAGGAIGDAVKGYFGEVRQDPGKGVADALELGVTAMGGAAPQAFWMATSPSEANAGEDAILAQRRKMMQGLLAD